jgi:gluconate 5-dehydrogenase
MPDWLQLAGRPTLVLGAGGLGGASALALAEVGARAEIVTLVADLRTADACRGAVRETGEAIGAPEVFLHAIGRNVREPVEELTDEDWDSTLNLNLSVTFLASGRVGLVAALKMTLSTAVPARPRSRGTADPTSSAAR